MLRIILNCSNMKNKILLFLTSFFILIKVNIVFCQVDNRFIDSNIAFVSNYLSASGNDSGYYSALDELNENLQIYKNENGITDKYLLGRGYYAKGIVERDYDKSLSVFSESIDYCSQKGFKRIGALISNDLANIYLDNGETKKALQIFNRNIEIFKEVKDWGAFTWLLIDIGNIYNSDGYFERAQEYYYKAIEVSEIHFKDQIQEGVLAVCYQNLGTTYENIEVLDSAYVFYHRSLQSRIRSKQYANYSVAYSYLISYFQKTNQPDSTEFYIKKAIENDKKNGPNSHLINSYSMYINFLLQNKRFDEANNIGLLNYKSAVNSKNDIDIQNSASSLGITYFYLNKLDSALKYFIISANKSKSLNRSIDYSNQLSNIIKTLKLSNKTELTPYYYDELLKVKDKLNDNNATKLQLNREMESRKLEKKAFETEKNRQRIISISLTVIIVLVLMILALIIRTEYRKSKQNIKLKKALNELEEVNEHLNKTYSIIAHDLKGPLGNVVNMIELLLDGTVEREEWPQYLDMTYKTLNQTNSLMLNLLDWSRAKGEKLSFVPTQVKVKEVIDSTISLHRHSISQKEIDVKLNIEDNISVYSDENMFFTVARSLLSNAIKFTPEGGNISISATEHDNIVRIKIKDNGVGMSSKQITDALDINTFNTSLGTNEEKGSGLGLKLVLDMLDRNNGKLEINSTVGNGSEFIIILPKSAE